MSKITETSLRPDKVWSGIGWKLDIAEGETHGYGVDEDPVYSACSNTSFWGTAGAIRAQLLVLGRRISRGRDCIYPHWLGDLTA